MPTIRKSALSAAPVRLSIVIPTYNEAERLPRALSRIHAFLAAQGWLATTEIIIADDGSGDGTGALAVRAGRAWPQLAVLLLPHQGKGAAVRQGMLATRGAFVFFCDVDLSMPIEQIVRFLPPTAPAADIIIGSREAPGAQRYDEPPYRHLMGRVFNTLVRLLVLRGIADTQCGFKCFTRTAAQDLCAAQTLPGFSFDVELLALARARGYTIAEIPIDWHHERHSRVRPIRDTIMMVRDIWQVRQRMRHVVPARQTAEDGSTEDTEVFTADHGKVFVNADYAREHAE